MAVAISRHGIARLSSSCSPFTFLSGRTGIHSSSFCTVGTASKRIVAPLLFVFSPVQGGAQFVPSPRDSQVKGMSSTSRGCFDDAVVLLASAPVLPKLVVLDLDFTVWPFYCDYLYLELHLELVICRNPKSPKQLSGHGDAPKIYPDVVNIVKALAAYKVEMAIASRTPSASIARTFLDQLSISQYFPVKEIYFTIYSKTKHFSALKEKTGIPYNSMLFFDDEIKNITAAAKLGVTGIVVTEGLDLKSLETGLTALASKN